LAEVELETSRRLGLLTLAEEIEKLVMEATAPPSERKYARVYLAKQLKRQIKALKIGLAAVAMDDDRTLAEVVNLATERQRRGQP
jgi:hypothetical protein